MRLWIVESMDVKSHSGGGSLALLLCVRGAETGACHNDRLTRYWRAGVYDNLQRILYQFIFIRISYYIFVLMPKMLKRSHNKQFYEIYKFTQVRD